MLMIFSLKNAYPSVRWAYTTATIPRSAQLKFHRGKLPMLLFN